MNGSILFRSFAIAPWTCLVMRERIGGERREVRMTELNAEEAGIIERLLQIIADEGLVDRSKLEPHAQLDEIGVSADDLVLIGNAIEREFDRDILSDDEVERCVTVRELVSLFAKRISAQNAG